jgi:hypothetical protein
MAWVTWTLWGVTMAQPRHRLTLRELIDQLQAEAVRVSKTGMDEQKRTQLDVIRRRIDEIRVSLGRTDS